MIESAWNGSSSTISIWIIPGPGAKGSCCPGDLSPSCTGIAWPPVFFFFSFCFLSLSQRLPLREPRRLLAWFAARNCTFAPRACSCLHNSLASSEAAVRVTKALMRVMIVSTSSETSEGASGGVVGSGWSSSMARDGGPPGQGRGDCEKLGERSHTSLLCTSSFYLT